MTIYLVSYLLGTLLSYTLIAPNSNKTPSSCYYLSNEESQVQRDHTVL